MNKIEFGDCRETMRRWAEQGIKAQTCVTSPPYFGLRDYGHEGQIGLEETPEQYISAMVEVFRCVWDVLADDGTVWLNIGDSYAGSGKGPAGNLGKTNNERDMTHTRSSAFVPDGCKPKDLIGIPWMLAFALRADGWYLRQDIIWHKPNPMPESVRDRCTKAHEYIFLLSKSNLYYFDSEAMKEPATNAGKRVVLGKKSFSKGQAKGNNVAASGNGLADYYDVPETRNRRSVWTVTTKPYKGAHFATFPPDLIEPCILAGSSEKGHCPSCGNKWVRKVERTRMRRDEFEPGDLRYRPSKYSGAYEDINGKGDAGYSFSRTLGWEPTCECGLAPVPDIVLDPFMGSGTTAQVALQHKRQYLGCELNEVYKPLQEERIAKASPEPSPQINLFSEVA